MRNKITKALFVLFSAIAISGCAAAAKDMSGDSDYLIGKHTAWDYKEKSKAVKFASFSGNKMYYFSSGHIMYPVDVTTSNGARQTHMVILNNKLEVLASVAFNIEMKKNSTDDFGSKERELNDLAKKIKINKDVVEYKDGEIEIIQKQSIKGVKIEKDGMSKSESPIGGYNYSGREVKFSECTKAAMESNKSRDESSISAAKRSIIAIDVCKLQKKINSEPKTGEQARKTAESIFTTTMGIVFGVIFFPITVPAFLFFWGISEG